MAKKNNSVPDSVNIGTNGITSVPTAQQATNAIQSLASRI